MAGRLRLLSTMLVVGRCLAACVVSRCKPRRLGITVLVELVFQVPQPSLELLFHPQAQSA